MPEGESWTHCHFSRKNRCVNPAQPELIEGQVDRDITNLTILVEPGPPPKLRDRNLLDPAMVADFDEARAGPITGVPPRP